MNAEIKQHHVVLGDLRFPYEPVERRAGPTGRFLMRVPRFAADGTVAGDAIVPCVGYIGLRRRAEGFAAHADKLKEWRH